MKNMRVFTVGHLSIGDTLTHVLVVPPDANANLVMSHRCDGQYAGSVTVTLQSTRLGVDYRREPAVWCVRLRHWASPTAAG